MADHLADGAEESVLRQGMEVKAGLLAEGVALSPRFIDRFGRPFLAKRRAYGNPDDLLFLDQPVPQELIVLPSRLVSAVNIRRSSTWTLDWDGSQFNLCNEQYRAPVPTTFPMHPWFYDQKTRDGEAVSSSITLYGGGSLGVFAYGWCGLLDMGAGCGYCSLEPNRSRQKGFARVVSRDRLRQSLEIALRDAECPISQVMLNGGNLADPNLNFRFYAGLASTAREVIDASGREVELHLIVYPPHDLSLFALLDGLDVRIAMNCEVFDPGAFERFCPGKAAVSGQGRIVEALRHAAEHLGAGWVYSIFVGGLESLPTLRAGLELMTSIGVTPVINVFHPDPGTPLAELPGPTVEMIMDMGSALQDSYRRTDWVHPFYFGCGRNAIDTEAYLGLFPT